MFLNLLKSAYFVDYVELDRGEEVTVNEGVYGEFAFESTVLTASALTFGLGGCFYVSGLCAIFDCHQWVDRPMPSFISNLSNRMP